jgi:peroxiredoxin
MNTIFHMHPRNIAVSLVLCISLLSVNSAESNAASLAIGANAPSFTLKNVDGKNVSLADFSAKPAVCVVFTCNHCPFAKAYEDRIIELQKEYASKGVQFVLINPNDPVVQPEDSFEKMQKRAQEKSYPFPYIIDETQDIARAYGAFRTPEAYLLDSNRKLVYHGLIDDNTEVKDVKTHHLKNAIENLLADTPDQIDPKDTKAFGCTIKWKK